MSATPDSGPLVFAAEADLIRIRFRSRVELLAEIPAGYATEVTERLRSAMNDPQQRLVVDLESVRGLSSRQLGLLLLIRKALEGRLEPVPLVGVSPGVRRLLQVTQTARFFDMDATDPGGS